MSSNVVDSLVYRLAEATDEKEMHSICKQIFERLKKVRQKYDFNAMLSQQFFIGEQWIDANVQTFTLQSRSTGLSDKVTVNICEPSIRAHVSNFIKRKPDFVVTPLAGDQVFNKEKGPIDPVTGLHIGEMEDGPEVKAAKAGEIFVQQVLEDNNFNVQASEHLIGAFVTGHGYWMVDWEQKKNNLKGVVDLINIPYWNLYYDVACRDPITFSDARVVDYVVPTDTYELSLKIKEKLNNNSQTVASDGKMSPSTFDTSAQGYRQSNTEQTDTALLHRMFVRVPYTKELTTTDETTGEEIGTGETIIDHEIRCYQFTADDFVSVEVNPMGYNMFPFCGTYINKNINEPYALGILRNVRPLQYTINWTFTRLSRIAKLMSNPLWVVPTGQKDNMKNTTGLVVEAAQGQEPKLIQGANAPSSLVDTLNLALMKAQDILSVQDVMFGRMPPGVTSGAQVQVLLEANTAATGLWITNYESCLKHMAKLILLTVREKYAKDDLEPIRLVTQEGVGGLAVYELDLAGLNFENIKLSIEQGMTSTRSGQAEQIQNLVRLGIITNKRAALKAMGYQNIDDLVSADDQEVEFRSGIAAQAQKQQMAQQQMQQPIPPQQPSPAQPQAMMQ